MYPPCARDEHEYSNIQILKYVGPQINNCIWIITLLILKYIRILAYRSEYFCNHFFLLFFSLHFVKKIWSLRAYFLYLFGPFFQIFSHPCPALTSPYSKVHCFAYPPYYIAVTVELVTQFQKFACRFFNAK